MKSVVLALGILIAGSVKAQTAGDSIKATINNFFDGMESNDTAKIRTTVEPGCFLKTIARSAKGETILVDDTMDDFFAEVIKAKGMDADEQLLSFDIRIDGAMAMVWAPYKIYFNKKFSHCGVNVFTMIRRDGNWKILGITDTRRRQDCE